MARGRCRAAPARPARPRIARELRGGRAIALTAVVVATVAGLRAAATTPPQAAARQICIPRLLPCPSPPPPPPPASREPLALGLTEADPRLLVASRPGSAGARAVALQPRYVRVLVDWARVQPRAGRAPNWNAPPGGCPASAPRCGTARGLRGLLEAIKARRKADGGWQILVVPYFTPAWAAVPASGCERPGTTPRARMPRIDAYRAFLRALQRLGDEAGVDFAYWSPWNEPNHPAFLNPQRATCDIALARAGAGALRAARARRGAGAAPRPAPRARRPRGPRHAAAVRRERRRVRPRAAAGRRLRRQRVRPARVHRRARPQRAQAPAGRSGGCRDRGDRASSTRSTPSCACHGCDQPLWITETGTFDHRCESMAAALKAWADDPRVDAAFQYTFREHPSFPVGLVSSSLRTTYRSYTAWHAFSVARGDAPQAPCTR